MITIEGSNYHHLIRVLRLKVGDSLVVVDTGGREYLARLVAIEARAALAGVFGEQTGTAEPPVAVTLIVGLPKGDKLALITQKATELGVSRIIPVSTKRSTASLGVARERWRSERWQAIVEAAAGQCGRRLVPPVDTVQSLEQALRALPQETVLIMPWEGERRRGLREMAATLRGAGSIRVALLIGPEGGWAQEEVNLARRYGALTVSLGPRILRCETAAISALTIVLYELGDLGGVPGGKEDND